MTMSIHGIYGPIIKEAFKPEVAATLTDDDVNEIEDMMRHEVFHSTLDWQSRAVLKRGARTAWRLVQFVREDLKGVASV